MSDPAQRPSLLFDRELEWSELAEFVSVQNADALHGLRLGVLYGRRRQGKSEILQQLTDTVGGFYHLALEQHSRPLALRRFADEFADWYGLPRGVRFDTWEEALETAVRMSGERAVTAGRPQLLVLDELPFLTAHSPELPGVIQAIYDKYGPTRGNRNPPVRLVLCGSALSVMSQLLSERKALYGRAMLNICLNAFDHIDMAQFWGIDDPETALRLHAIIGGVPGYKAITAAAPTPRSVHDIDTWLAATVFNPAHALFDEVDLLFTQEPGIKDRALYYAILAAVAGGEGTPARIASRLERDSRTISYPLGVLRQAGLISYDQDLLLNRKPVVSIADPIMRFHHAITIPRLQLFQRRNLVQRAWQEAKPTFAAQVLGPHFEALARDWTITTLGARFGVESGWTGTTTVACREHGTGHKVDVVSLAPGQRPRKADGPIALLGEAKATNRPRTVDDLARLEHIRTLLEDRAAGARLAVFSRTGFDDDLAEVGRAGGAILVSLADMYER